LVVVVVLGLVGAVGFLLSQLNARTFTIEDQNGSLVVLKGRELPLGSDPYKPQDAALADAYAALPLDGMPLDPALLQQRFTDRDELDRALFEVLQKLALPRVATDDPAALERGFYYMQRADKLGGITPDQRTQLQKLKADVSFYQGRVKLDEARKRITDALAELRLAADSQNRHSRSANQMLLAVEKPAKALEDALREAVNSLSTPPPTPTPAVDAPKPGTPAPTPTAAPAAAAPAPTPAAPTAAPPAPTPQPEKKDDSPAPAPPK
ncbi:MAG TPA: IF-2 protein, partial [Myxococcaceae bacterium]|nr:IF-2 protein [Myxococcaceae bacterium]